jgi:predicted ABC-type ATPase
MQFKQFIKEEKNVTPDIRDHNLVILYGMPASGKSSVLKYGLINLPNIQVLTSDKWTELLAHKEKKDLSNAETTSDLHRRVSPKFDIHRYNATHVRNRANIVIEKIGSSYQKLLDLIVKSQADGFRVVLVWVKVDLETSIKANQTRNRRVPTEAIEISYKNTLQHFNQLVDKVEEAWIIDNDTRPNFNDFRSSRYIKRIK